MYYKISIEFPDNRTGYSATGSLEELRRLADVAWSKLEGWLDDPWSQVLGIDRPQVKESGYDVAEQLLGAYNAWSGYMLDTLTPDQIGMIWAYDGGSYTVEEVQS